MKTPSGLPGALTVGPFALSKILCPNTLGALLLFALTAMSLIGINAGAAYILFPVLLLTGLASLKGLWPQKFDLPTLTLLSAGVYVIFVIGNTYLFHPQLLTTEFSHTVIMLALGFAPFCAGLAQKQSPENKLFFAALLLLEVVLVGQTFCSYFLGWGEVIDMRGGIRRAYGLAGDGFTPVVVFLALLNMLRGKSLRLALLVAMLLLNGAKLGLGLTLIGAVLALPFIYKQKQLRLGLVLGLAGGLLLGLGSTHLLHQLQSPVHIEHTAKQVPSTYWASGIMATGLGRIISAQAGLSMILQTPLTGVGYNMSADPVIFREAVLADPLNLRERLNISTERFLAEADISNQFIQTFAELGLFGFLALLAFCLGAVLLALRCYKRGLQGNFAELPLAGAIWILCLILFNQTASWCLADAPALIILCFLLGRCAAFYRQNPLPAAENKISAPQLFMLTNIANATIGFIQGLVLARLLHAAGFGYVGIFVTLGGLVSNFWDVRLTDLANQLHFKLLGQADKQSANARAVLMLNCGLALMMALSTVIAGWLCWPLFTEQVPQMHWLVIQGIAIASIFMVGCMQSLQRLTEHFGSYALGRLLAQTSYTACVIICLLLISGLEGYYLGLLFASLSNLIIAFTLLTMFWRRHFRHSLWQGSLREGLAHYRGQMSFILSANVFSYSKMLSRGADVLIFSYFSSDAITGVYRLARTLADGLGLFTDALAQYYVPRFMKLHATDNRAVLRDESFVVFRNAGLALLILLPTAYVATSFISHTLLAGEYTGLASATVILMSIFLITGGVHSWLWAFILHHSQMKTMAITSTIGGLTQCAVIALMCIFFGPRADLAALGSIAYYLVCYPPLLFLWKRTP